VRIVSLIPGATEMIAALGLRDELVGITHSCDYPAGLSAAVVTSTSIPYGASSDTIDRTVRASLRTGRALYELDVALIEALEPDVVVTQSVCDVCAVGDQVALASLEGLSIRPDFVSLHPHRFEDVLHDMLRIGESVGAVDRARALVDQLRERVLRTRTRTDGKRRVTVAVLEWIDPLFSAGHWTPDIVADAGGREVLGSPGARSREIAWEELVDQDPEVLVLACCGQSIPRALEDLQLLEARPGFAELRAVRTGRVHVADGGAHFSRPGPRLVESLELLAEVLHPSGHRDRPSLPRARRGATW